MVEVAVVLLRPPLWSDLHPEVALLRQFRDRVLKRSPLGRHAVYFYYETLPRLRIWLNRHPTFKAPVRWSLKFLQGSLEIGLETRTQTEIVGHDFTEGKGRSS